MVHPARATYDDKTLARQDAFLIAYAKLGNVTEAATSLTPHVHPDTIWGWKNANTLGFAARYFEAHRQYGDFLEATVRKRLEEPQFNGRIGGDVLLIAANNAHNPERWRRDTVVIGTDVAKEMLGELFKLASRSKAQVVEGAATPVQEAEAQVRKMLQPPKPPDP